jgi:biotin operon repressor
MEKIHYIKTKGIEINQNTKRGKMVPSNLRCLEPLILRDISLIDKDIVLFNIRLC